MTIRERLFGRKKKEEDDAIVHPSDAPGVEEKDRSTGTIGKYEIVEKIGSGGFGTVYKAWDPVIKRHVAIKTCEVGSKDIRNRFLREAQLAGGLQHPNITLVYEFGFEGDVPYMVQEFLSGEDLDRLIKRNAPLPLQDKLRILIGVVFGLEYAHKAGIMHRDVKPANVRVLDNRSVKIMDFGIAKSVEPADDITQTGITIGSSSYMSPEQIGGDSVDFRTDIFSFGILAYELLTSRKPFHNDNLFLLLEQIVKESPEALAELVPDLPLPLVLLVERAMQKRPEDRFQSAKELRNALVSIQQEIAPAEAALADALTAERPQTESARLVALERLEILDTGPEREFDDLARLASQLCGTPVALISFLDRDREWYKSAIGLTLREVPRILAFSTDAMLKRDVLILPDLASDARFADNPLVAGDPKLRFCAAAPLLTSEGFAVGMLCVLDREPRELSPSQVDGLRTLARQVMAQVELKQLRRSGREESSEKLMLEVAGLADRTPSSPEGEKPL
jgi:serine/threonine protein kinase